MVLQDFGTLRNDGRIFPTDSRLEAVGHPVTDQDRHVRTSYIDAENRVVVEAVVSQYGDPTWLAHEFEGQYRTAPGFSENLTIVGGSGSRRFVLLYSSTLNSGGVVGWLSAQATIVEIEFTYRRNGQAAEVPDEVVDAYLALYPSSLPDSVADTPEHHTEWIRNEMQRILEYAKRDHTAGRLGEVERWLKRFAEFRQRFYGTGSAKQFEFDRIANALGGEGTEEIGIAAEAERLAWLGERLAEFEVWWTVHQNDPVLLPTPGATPPPEPTLRVPKLAPEDQELLDRFLAPARTAAAQQALSPSPAPTP
jgi:hypothetical protein